MPITLKCESHCFSHLTSYSSCTLLFQTQCSLVKVSCQELQSVNHTVFFPSLHSISLVWCLLRNLFSFNFWARLSSKNVGGKSCCSSLECSLASEFGNQNFMKMWSIHPCHVWFLWLLQSWLPISYSKRRYIGYVFFFPKYLWKHKTK